MRTSDTKEFKNSIWFCFRQKKRLGRYNKLPVVGRFPVSYHRPTKHSLKVKKMAEHFTSVTNINQWIHHFTLTLKRKHERIEWNIEREKKHCACITKRAHQWICFSFEFTAFDSFGFCTFQKRRRWSFMTWRIRNKNRKRSQMSANNAISLFSNVSDFLSFYFVRTISLARQNSSQFDCAIVTLLLYISCIGSEKVTSLSLL